jgi:glycosyltransferase involved in cell wall biosynthesis
MRIGFDGSCLANRRGFGRFARKMLAALERTPNGHTYVVFVDRPSAAASLSHIPQRFERVVVDVAAAPSRAASARGRRRVRDMLAMGRAVAKARLDLMYFPASYSFFPVWNVKRVVVTLHDTLALAHPDLVFPTWQGRVSWALKEHAAVRWADRILTVSESARRDLVAWFRLPEKKVRIVTEGPDAVFKPCPAGPESDAALARCGLAPDARYLLYVGGLSPHKNLPRLIEAFAAATSAPERTAWKLVLIGDVGDVFYTHVPELRAAVARLGLGGRVLLPGFVPDAELVHVYNRAYALVQPSLLEGFGLPPVEAMACGTPVLFSRAGSLPEVVGGAGLDFDPTDVGEMVRAIERLLDDPALRNRLGRQALHRAQRYTWSAAARALLDCFHEFDDGRSWRRTA